MRVWRLTCIIVVSCMYDVESVAKEERRCDVGTGVICVLGEEMKYFQVTLTLTHVGGVDMSMPSVLGLSFLTLTFYFN